MAEYELDYERLNKALADTLRTVEYLKISIDRLEKLENEKLGWGGYGEVFAGTLASPDPNQPPTRVAIKVLRTVGSQINQTRMAVALAREIRLWAQATHPNVLTLLGFHLDARDHVAWLVSPLMTNGNIREYFRKTKPDLQKRHKAVIEFSEALAYLHGRSTPICHGDLKPDNILIKDDGAAVLCDFGLATAAEREPSGLTTSLVLKGTTRYFAPELVDYDVEEPRRTLKSDVWAWGCVVAELMTDRPPYEDCLSDIKLIQAIIKGPPPSAREIPGVPFPLITAAFHDMPHLRPQALDCLTIVRTKVRFDEVVESPSVPSTEPGVVERRPSLPARWYLIVSTLIAKGNIKSAVQHLEYAKMVNYAAFQPPMQGLRTSHPSLAASYIQLTNQLEAFPPMWTSSSHDPYHETDIPAQPDATLEEWVRVVQQMRKISGWEGFLNRPSFEDLQRAADHGPVIILNVSSLRSDAIIVQRDQDPSFVSLLGLSASKLLDLSQQHMRNMTNLIVEPRWTGIEIARLLGQLWETIVRPVVDFLCHRSNEDMAVNRKRRIWWSLDSIAWALPLHAAGHYGEGGRKLHDNWISSYAVSLDILLRINADKGRRISRSNILFLGEANSNGGEAFPSVEEELRRVQNVASCVRLADANASTRTLQKSISRHSMLHLAWCLDENPNDLFNSTFRANGGIKVSAIFNDGDAQNVHLAFFVCCHGHPSLNQPNNHYLSFGAAMQLAGLNNLVATMRDASDQVTPAIAESFYSHLFHPSNGELLYSNAAEALDGAVDDLRDQGIPLYRWFNYVHYGG